MKRLSTLAVTLLVLLASTRPARAEKRRATAAPPDDSLAIAFIDVDSGDASMTAAGSEAWIDLKTVTHAGVARERMTKMRRRIGIRLERANGLASGTATISVRLESWDGRATFRLDGRQLSSAPVTIDTHLAVGPVTVHTLEIDIPISAAEGALTASMRWEAIVE
ncbi:MAG TPA: hypothetical protein VNN25_22030 [Thermoanaerobaculia bacterium]|nr:hypothetical protein [Thermoanaerobaculia bacterium]